MKKKVLSIVLAVMMVLSVMPLAGISAFAADVNQPVAKREEITVPGLDYAVIYTIDKEGADSYDSWNVDFVVTASKDVAEGAVTLVGQYDAFSEDFVPFPAFAMKAGTPVSLLASAGMALTYGELVANVGEFTCGLINNSLAEKTDFKIEIVLTNGDEKITVEGSKAEPSFEQAVPVAEWKEVKVDGLDYAVEYTYANKGAERYKDWYVDFELTADKDVAPEQITIAGMYGDYGLISYKNENAIAANTAYKIIEQANAKLTYGELVSMVDKFTCGIKDNAITKDTKFTINIVLFKDTYEEGEAPITVEYSNGTNVETTLYVKPVANKEVVTVDELDYAVKYSIKSAGSDYYNNWDAGIYITADRNVAEGEVQLGGKYGAYNDGALVLLNSFAMEEGVAYNVIDKVKEALGATAGVTYKDIVDTIQEFTCGVKNVNLAEDTNFTVEIKLNKGDKSFVVEGSVAESVEIKADVKPVVTYESTTLEDCDYAVNYTVETPASANYNNWNADILIKANKDIAAGDVTLKGQYGEYGVVSATPAFTANEAVSLLGLLGATVTYAELAAISEAGGFTCGVKNEYVGEDVDFTVEIILTDGETTFTVDGSKVEDATVEAVDIKPVVEFDDTVTLDDCDYAVKYTSVSRASTNYNNWNADILIKANKDIAAGDVTLKGQYGEYGVVSATPAFTANEAVSLMGLLGATVTYAELAEIADGFTCGVKNEYVGEDVDFTVEIILTDGETTFTVDGSLVEDATVEAVDIKPVVTYGTTTLEDCDYAVKYTSVSRGSTNYNNWNADILIKANKNIAAGDVTLKGQYGEYGVVSATPAFTANEAVSLMGLLGATVTYAELAAIVDGFTCGVKNENLAEDVTFTVEIILTDGESTFIVDGSKVEDATIEATITPEIYTVTVTNGAKVSKTLDTSKSAKYELATVTIKEANGVNENGDWFVYWVDDNGNIISTYSTYSFFVVKNITLTPVYVAKANYNEERAKGILVTDIVRMDNNEDGTATIFAEHSASKAAVGNSIRQHGILWTTEELSDTDFVLTNEEVNKAAAVKSNRALTGLHVTTVSADGESKIYARSYLTDANGKTVYGGIKEVAVTEISTSSQSLSCESFEAVLGQAEEIIHTVTETEDETAPTFMSVLMNIINVIVALFQSIIAQF